MNLRDVLAPIDGILKRHRIRYAVIGGYAVAAWGDMRATRDVDLLCSAADLKSLKSVLGEAGIGFEHRSGDSDDPISDVIRIQGGESVELYEVDILVGIRGAPAGLLDRVREVVLQDLTVPVAAPEDMIILKLLGASPRDLEDARSILRAQKGKMDLGLIVQLCPDSLRHNLEKLLITDSSD